MCFVFETYIEIAINMYTFITLIYDNVYLYIYMYVFICIHDHKYMTLRVCDML